MANEQNLLSGLLHGLCDELRELRLKFSRETSDEQEVMSDEETERVCKQLLHYIALKIGVTTYWWFSFQDSAADIFHEMIVMGWSGRRKWNREKYPDLTDFLKSVVDNILYHRVNNWYAKHVSKVSDLSSRSNDSGVDHRGDDLDRASVAAETAHRLANVEKDFLKSLRDFLREKKDTEKLVQIVNLIILFGASKPSEIASKLGIEKKVVYRLFARLRQLVNEYRVTQNVEQIVLKLVSVAQGDFHLWLKEIGETAGKDNDKKILGEIAQVTDCLLTGTKAPSEIAEKLGAPLIEVYRIIAQLPGALSQYCLEKKVEKAVRQIASVKNQIENEIRVWLSEKVKEGKDERRGKSLEVLLECIFAGSQNFREIVVELHLTFDGACKLIARLWELVNEYQAEANAQLIAQRLVWVEKRAFRAWLNEIVTRENGTDKTFPLRELGCLVDCLGGGFISLDKMTEKLKPSVTQVAARLEELLAFLNEYCADANVKEIAKSFALVGVDDELRTFLTQKEQNDARLQQFLQIIASKCARPQEIAIQLRIRNNEAYELLARLRQLIAECHNKDYPFYERPQPTLSGSDSFHLPTPQPAQ